MNIIQRYEQLVDERRWAEALPVIRKIIDQAPHVGTSWFNYGVCLDELGRHSEAAEAFIKAQESAVEDWGIHYRIFRSLFLAESWDLFLDFADYSCGLNPEMIYSLCDDNDFGPLFAKPAFARLRKKYWKRQAEQDQGAVGPHTPGPQN